MNVIYPILFAMRTAINESILKHFSRMHGIHLLAFVLALLLYSPSRVSSAVSEAERLQDRRNAAYEHIVTARSYFISAEDFLAELYEKGISTASSEELDKYQTYVALALSNALSAYFLVSGKARLPRCNCELPAYLDNLPADYFDELLYPDDLVELVRTGILPDLPYHPLKPYVHNVGVSEIPNKFQPFVIFYKPVISQRGYFRNEGGFPEGAVLLVFGTSESSQMDPRFYKVNVSWLKRVIGSVPNGVVGAYVQIADED